MRSALRSWNEVDVGFGRDVTALWQPLNSPIHCLSLTRKAHGKGLLRNDRVVDSGIREIVGDTVFVEPLLLFALFLVVERDT